MKSGIFDLYMYVQVNMYVNACYKIRTDSRLSRLPTSSRRQATSPLPSRRKRAELLKGKGDKQGKCYLIYLITL